MLNISVIIPAYRAADTIYETLNSIFTQTYKPKEIIVILDGPDEATKQILLNKSWEHLLKIIEVRENIGVAHARNLGLSASTGQYIAFCDADDLWHPRKLEMQVADLGKGYKILGSAAVRFLGSWNISTFDNILQEGGDGYQIKMRDLITSNPFYFSSVIVWVGLIDNEKFDIYSPHEDYQFLIDIFRMHNDLIAKLDSRKLIGYRISQNSRSGNILKSFFNNYRVKLKNFGFYRTCMTLPAYIVKTVGKRLS